MTDHGWQITVEQGFADTVEYGTFQIGYLLGDHNKVFE
jgi:hypothetical protein